MHRPRTLVGRRRLLKADRGQRHGAKTTGHGSEPSGVAQRLVQRHATAHVRIPQTGIDLSDLRPELTYRRLQIAVHRNDEIGIESLLAELHALGGIFSDNADRLVYDRARRLWRLNEDDVIAATRVANSSGLGM